MTEEELSIFTDGCGLGNDSEVAKFSSIRKALEIRNKYLKQYNESNK
jgi:hypothetical protein